MSTTTSNLGLFKYTESDYEQVFDFRLALNGNWDMLDNDIYNKEDKLKAINTLATSGTINLDDNSINNITPTENIIFTLPIVSDNTVFHQILVQVNLSTVYSITLGTSYFFNSTAPNMSTTGVYNLFYEYDNINQYWVVGCLAKGASS